MKSPLSALILSTNFITSSTLSGILRKFNVHKIFEVDSDRTVLSNILNTKPELIFIDLKEPDHTSLETVLQLSAFSGGRIAVLTFPEHIDDWKVETSDYKNISILSKTCSTHDIEHFSNLRHTESFFEKAL
jgi:two-component SAPR family response regulator